MKPDRKLALDLLRGMKRIRLVEESIAERYLQGEIRCPTHLSIGQEAAATAVGAALYKTDFAISSHRAHAHYLAKGGGLNAMLAEIFGKVTGCCRGRGGSMHLTDRSVGFVGSTAIVGNSIPVGVGLALSMQLKRLNNVSAVFFGDGCIEEGSFYESVNFAVVRKLPVLFICENNLYSVYSPLSVRQPEGREIFKMVEAMGLPSAISNGNDVEEAYVAAQKAIDYVRSGCGPFFLELTTYRWLEHCGPNFDNHIGYRSEEEFLEWQAKDPIPAYQNVMISRGWLTQADILLMRDQLAVEINKAFTFAADSPFPAQEEAFSDEYANKKDDNL
jgi:TPP-dependent pyruvate/acetoin dehydrogenase alpha subunit